MAHRDVPECWRCGEAIVDQPADAYVRMHNPQWLKFPFTLEVGNGVAEGEEGLCVLCCIDMDPASAVIPPAPDFGGQA